MEHEKLWLQSKAILFVGVIKDIITYNETFYTLTIERSIYSRPEYDFSTDIQLSLIASKHQIDDLLEKNPDIFKDFGFNNNVAVIAKVTNIQSTHTVGADTVEQELKVGTGELVDIEYVGDIHI